MKKLTILITMLMATSALASKVCVIERAEDNYKTFPPLTLSKLKDCEEGDILSINPFSYDDLNQIIAQVCSHEKEITRGNSTNSTCVYTGKVLPLKRIIYFTKDYLF